MQLLRIFRVLVATIKDFGLHPCPQCLVAINEIHVMMLKDARRLTRHASGFTTKAMQLLGTKLKTFWKTSQWFQRRYLNPHSPLCKSQCRLYRTCSFCSFLHLVLTSTKCWLLTSSTRWNLACGSRCWRISSRCFMSVGQEKSTSSMNGMCHLVCTWSSNHTYL